MLYILAPFLFLIDLVYCGELHPINRHQSQEWPIGPPVSKSKVCGEIFLLDSEDPLAIAGDVLSYSGNRDLKKKKVWSYHGERRYFKTTTINKWSYHTKTARLFIPPVAKPKAFVERFLLQQVRNLVQKHWQQESGDIAGVEEYFDTESLHKIEELIFPKPDKNVRQVLDFYMMLYPRLRQKIITSHNAIKPLLCYHEHRHHNIKLAYRYSHLLVIPAVGFTIAALVIVPPLAIPAGIAGGTMGVRDLYMGYRNYWAKEKAGRFAKKLMLVYKQMQMAEENLEKLFEAGALQAEEEKLLVKLRDFKNKQRRDELKDIVKSRRGNRLLLAFGALNLVFNGFGATGNAETLMQFGGLAATILQIIT